MRLDELETPALAIDLDIMDRNLHRAAAYAHEHNLRIRPHTKTHKIPDLAVRQLSLGAAGITVAKVGEAEVMMKASPRDFRSSIPSLVNRSCEGSRKSLAERASVLRSTVSWRHGVYRRRRLASRLNSAYSQSWMRDSDGQASSRQNNSQTWRARSRDFPSFTSTAFLFTQAIFRKRA